MLPLSLEHVNDWSYLTEGNAHVVLNYVGNDTALTGHVLRLTKNHSNINVPLDFNTEFSKHVITPLLGPGYVDTMIYTQVTMDFIQAMSEKIYCDRPEHRRKDPLHPTTHAFLTKNWTLFYAPQDTWTFEIKPKWGFLPNSSFIDPAHQFLKKRMCRFCMHQQLRQRNKLKHDRYCPLDLYSNDPQRIRKALTASFTRPHTYLKLFHNGQLVPPTHWGAALAPLLFDQDTWMEQAIDLLTGILLDDPILQTLKRLQQSLDEYDVEGIYPLYGKHGQQTTHTIDQWKIVVQHFLNRQSQIIDGKQPDDVMSPEQEELQRLYEYVLSMTFKDCSVMICLTKDYQSNNKSDTRRTMPGHTTTYSGLQYQIKVVDVDMKKLNKIPYWFDLDRRIIQYNLGLMQQEHGWICLD
ncbi:inositol-pentakisphosphate 2-kinase [Chlamydoabsidia padenii]|nr:inositol-pentakisphosphate 2-kinase [Chlamydoabsidia padenii]